MRILTHCIRFHLAVAHQRVYQTLHVRREDVLHESVRLVQHVGEPVPHVECDLRYLCMYGRARNDGKLKFVDLRRRARAQAC